MTGARTGARKCWSGTRYPEPGARILKVPHVGWNALKQTGRPSRLLAGVQDEAQAYFTHSYVAPDSDATVAITEHGVPFASVVEHGLVFGAQFHPEKSGETGLRMLRNFLDVVEEGRARRAGPTGETQRLQAPTPDSRGTRPPTPIDEGRPGGALMLSKRIIACLDVRDGQVVKGINFEGLRNAGDPAELARRYNVEGIDELVILDVTATLEKRRTMARTVATVAKELFIPLAVGGGIASEDDAAAAVDAGADKVSINSAAVANPSLITSLARRYGSQAVVVAIDAKLEGDRFGVYVRSGSTPTGRDAVEWAREAADRGAGEILLTSIDKDGTRSGFDLPMTAAVSRAVSIPVIASGGAGTFGHFSDVFTEGCADAALAASVFHFSEHAVSELKAHLDAQGIPVRLR